MVRVKPRGRPSLEDDSEEADGYDDDFGIYGLVEGGTAGEEEAGAAFADAGQDGDTSYLQALQDTLQAMQQLPKVEQEEQLLGQEMGADLHEPSLQAWAQTDLTGGLLQQQQQHEEEEAATQQQQQQQLQEEAAARQQQQLLQEIQQLQQFELPPQQDGQHSLQPGLLYPGYNTALTSTAAAQQPALGHTAAAAAAGPGWKRSRKQLRPFSAAVGAAAAAAAGAAEAEGANGPPGKRTRGVAGVNYSEQAWDWASEEEPQSEEGAGGPVLQPGADENESNCHACGSAADEELLLCCEACPFVYHTYCLHPPLDGVPPGMWYCPVCLGAEDLLDESEGLDRILAVRKATAQADTAAASDGAGAEQQQPQQQGEQPNEFFVKWKNRSYLHCCWVSNEVMQRAAGIRVIGTANPVATRLRKFWREQQQVAANGDIREAEERGQLVNGINPAWTQVDKVLAERLVRIPTRRSSRVQHTAAAAAADEDSGGRSGVEFLVSWRELPFDQASWEAAEALKDFAAEIETYRSSLTSISAEASARKQFLQQAPTQQAQDQQEPGASQPANGSSAAAGRDSDRGQGSRKWDSTPDFVAGGELHPYQLEGLNWLYHKAQVKDNVILADEMGLGKTIQAIAYLGALWQTCVPLPHLLVVPLSVLPNWERELAVWAPYLRVVSLKGSAAARQLLLEHCWYTPQVPGKGKGSLQDRVRFHVLLTTYEMLSKHLADIKRLQWSALLVDEAHRLKSATSKLFQDLVRVDAQHRVLLTGTPLQNSLEELFYLMNFLEPDKFSNVEEFKAAYDTLNDKDKVAELHRQLAPHMLRRLKKDVLKQLPPKMEQMVRVELSDEQRELYKAILGRNYSALVASDKSRAVVRLRNVMMELRKVVNHPSLLGLDLETPAYVEAVKQRNAAAAAALESKGSLEPDVASSEALEQLVAASGKLALLDRIMGKLVAGGHRVLIYSQFTRTLDILEEWVVGRRWGFERIDGDVSGAVRQGRVDSFNAPNSSKVVFLLSTRAGGVGINLATADTVIIYDSDWNPHNDMQALARAHRMGQKRGVMVLRLVTRGTIEERMLQRAKSKMVLEHLVVSKAARADKLEQATLDDILQYGAQELFNEDSSTGTQAPDGQQQQQQQPGGDQPGSGSGKQQLRIVWDDAALERLLDRSQLGVVVDAAEAEEEEEDDFSKAFKVANFDMVAEPQQQQQQQQQQQAYTDPSTAQQHFWSELLKYHKPPDQPEEPTAAADAAGNDVAAAAAAASGSRRRRAAAAVRVSYLEELQGWDDISSSSEESAGEEQAEGEASARKAKKRKQDDDDEAWELPAEQMQEDSEEILDDADKDAEALADAALLAGSGHAAMQLQQQRLQLQQHHQRLAAQQVALARGNSIPRGQQMQPGQQQVQAHHSVAALLERAGAHVNERFLPAQVQAQAAQVQQQLRQKLRRNQELFKEALDGPFGANVAAANALRQQMQQAQVQQRNQVVPRVEGEGHMLRICGLNARERVLFLMALMQFGPPFVHQVTEDGWFKFELMLVGKTRLQLSSYLLVLLEHLSDCARDPMSTHGSLDYLPHSLFFWNNRAYVKAELIWERIAVMHLLSIKQTEGRNLPYNAPMCSDATNVYSQLSHQHGGWGPAQDRALVRGIFMAGYDNWGKILRLDELGLKEPVRIECGLPTDYDSSEAIAKAIAPARGDPRHEAMIKQQLVDRNNSNTRKERIWVERRVRALVHALMHDLAPRAAAAEQKMLQEQLRKKQTEQMGARPKQQPAAGAAAGAQQQLARTGTGSSGELQRAGSSGSGHGLLYHRSGLEPKRVHWAAAVQSAYNALRQKLVEIREAAQHVQPGDFDAVAAAGHKFRSSVQQLQDQAKQLEHLLTNLHGRVMRQRSAAAAAAAAPPAGPPPATQAPAVPGQAGAAGGLARSNSQGAAAPFQPQQQPQQQPQLQQQQQNVGLVQPTAARPHALAAAPGVVSQPVPVQPQQQHGMAALVPPAAAGALAQQGGAAAGPQQVEVIEIPDD